MIEEWKEIEGFSNYFISSFGNIKSLKRKVPRILLPDLNKEGYLRVSLSVNGKVSRFSVHRLVALHYKDNPENEPFVNHKDGNKQNNNSDNLEWCSCSYNTIHAFGNGLRIHGELAPNAQLTDEIVVKVCELIQSGLKRKQILDLELHEVLNKSKFDDIRSRKCWKRISINYQW